jgi:hypothetical protein
MRLTHRRSADALALETGMGAIGVVSLSVVMATKDSPAELAGYLWQVGCRVTVLPARVEDRRLGLCF